MSGMVFTSDMTTSRTIHPATGNVVEVISIDELYANFIPVATLVTYRTTLPTGFEIIGSYTVDGDVEPAYLPDPEPFPHMNWTD